MWEIDTWLMSCRVLGRKVEHMVLREILAHAREAGIRKLVGVYKPTDRNKLVIDHYAKLGFTKAHEEESGPTYYEFAVEEGELGERADEGSLARVCGGLGARDRMTGSNETNSSSLQEARLPRRDLVLLPAISLLTLFVLLAASEVLAREIWPEHGSDSCYAGGRIPPKL